MIGPELGLTQPGRVIVCGDSHTSTHGAFGAFAFGIGTTDVEHVLATQTIRVARPRTMEVRFTGKPGPGVGAKDLILALIGEIGIGGAAGHVIEYTGEAIRALSMEGRMTVCNMSIEAGARAGIIGPDETTFMYLMSRPRSPRGRAWSRAVDYWSSLATDPGAQYDSRVTIDASQLAPQVTWGTNPGMVTSVTERVPDPSKLTSETARRDATRALTYMGLDPGTPLDGLRIDRVFIGSCTNAQDRRPPGSEPHREGATSSLPRLGPRCAGIDAGESSGGAGRARPDLHRCGLRMAQRWMLDVPGHEPGYSRERRALRRHLEPEL